MIFFLAYSIKQKSISNINVPTVGCLERPGISDYTSFSHLAQNGMWTLKRRRRKGQCVWHFLRSQGTSASGRKGLSGMWFLLFKTGRGKEEVAITDCQRKQNKTMLNFSPGSDTKSRHRMSSGCSRGREKAKALHQML